MKYTMLGFSQQIAADYGLDLNDLAILRWFVDFKESGNMRSMEIDRNVYYWVLYEKILEELFIIKLQKSAVPTTKNIDYHIKILKELATKRNIYNLISDKAKTIKKMDGQDMIKLANEVKATVLDSPCIDDLFVDASDISLDTTPSPSIETGFAPLDAATSGGLNFGTLTVLTGSPGSGKSTFLNQILANALSLEFNSFLYSGELTSQMALDWFYKTVSNPIQHREPHVFDISGASEIANLSDYILNATRENDTDNETTILLLKNRITGLIKKHLQLKFSPDRKRFYTDTKLELERDYGYGEVYEQENFC